MLILEEKVVFSPHPNSTGLPPNLTENPIFKKIFEMHLLLFFASVGGKKDTPELAQRFPFVTNYFSSPWTALNFFEDLKSDWLGFLKKEPRYNYYYI